MKHKTKKEHYEKYKKLAEIHHVSLRSSSIFPPKKELMKLYKQDKHLNNIPLHIFDGLFLPGHHLTLAENTCMYKHLLLYEVLRLEPEFVD